MLDAGDLLRLQHDYRAFHLYGPKIQYSSSRNEGGRDGEPTYADLMVATDGMGQLRGYLASDESFRFLKQLETDNLVIPLVGNFAGPRAIRAVGQYLKERAATVSVFYVSNVEEYLQQDGVLPAFCANVASLPLDAGQHLHPLGPRPHAGRRVHAEFGADADRPDGRRLPDGLESSDFVTAHVDDRRSAKRNPPVMLANPVASRASPALTGR